MKEISKQEQSITVGTGAMYQELINSMGYIPSHRWEESSSQRVHILKSAISKDDPEQTVPNKLPSWVFVGEVLGTSVGRRETGATVGYEYEPKLNVIENIKLLIPRVKDEELQSSEYLKKAFEEGKISLEDKAGIEAFIMDNFEDWKREFIDRRTTVRVIMLDKISTKVDKYKQGILDLTLPEEVIENTRKSIADYYKITHQIVETKFTNENKRLASSDTELFNTKLSKTHLDEDPCTRCRSTGYIFVSYSNLSETARGVEEIDSRDGKVKAKTLASYELSRTKFQKILLASEKIKNPQFDTVTVRFEYKIGDKRAEMGKNLVVNPDEEGALRETEVYERFAEAVPNIAFTKMYGTNIMSFGEFEVDVKNWLIDNAMWLDKIPAEKLDRLNQDLLELIARDVKGKEETESYLESISYGDEEPVKVEQNEAPVKAEPTSTEAEYVSIDDIKEEEPKQLNATAETKATDEYMEKLKKHAEKLNFTVEQVETLVKQGMISLD